MSTNLSRLVEPFVMSVVVGKDVVPRASVVNLGRLIDEMVTAVSMRIHIDLPTVFLLLQLRLSCRSHFERGLWSTWAAS